jgi:hypothetical protein
MCSVAPHGAHNTMQTSARTLGTAMTLTSGGHCGVAYTRFEAWRHRRPYLLALAHMLAHHLQRPQEQPDGGEKRQHIQCHYASKHAPLAHCEAPDETLIHRYASGKQQVRLAAGRLDLRALASQAHQREVSVHVEHLLPSLQRILPALTRVHGVSVLNVAYTEARPAKHTTPNAPRLRPCATCAWPACMA